jgi:uncharacterized protein (TIGR04255 family)
MFEEYPRLSKAPIIEGLVDIRVRLPESFEVNSLAHIDPAITAAYPGLQTLWVHEGKLKFSHEEGFVGEASSPSTHGYRRLSQDKLNIAQFRRDGFTFSRLKPYRSWDRLFTEAMRLWKAYVETSDPHGVTRMATRFINRLELPFGVELEEFLKSAPPVPDELPQGLASFVVKYTSEVPDEKLRCNVTISTDQGSSLNSYPVIFDIDCFFHDQDLAAQDYNRIEEAFLKLRAMKNAIFFSTLTPKALEPMK